LPSQSFELETKPLPLEKDFLSYLSRDKRSKSNLTQAGLEPVIAAASTPLFLRQTGLQYGAHTEPGLTVGMLHLNLKTRNHEKRHSKPGQGPPKKLRIEPTDHNGASHCAGPPSSMVRRPGSPKFLCMRENGVVVNNFCAALKTF